MNSNPTAIRAFNYLWAAVTVSLFGTLITRVAIPYLAILNLAASDSAVAWLNMAEVLAGILGALFLGTWVDRASRKQLLIIADLFRAGLLLAIPLAWWSGHLSIALLALVAFAVGINTHLFGAAYNAYLPGVVPQAQLLTSNAKVRGSQAIAEAGSFSLGGVIVGVLGAPMAIVIDVVSYVASAMLIARIPNEDSVQVTRPASALSWTQSTAEFLRETQAGWRWIGTQRLMRDLLICTASLACWSQMMGVVYMLYVVRDLALSPALLGVLFAVGGASSLTAVIVVSKLSSRVRYGQILLYGLSAIFVGLLCLVIAPESNLGLAALAIILQQLIMDGGFSAFSLVEQTCKQTLSPDAMLGRVNGVAQWLQSIGQILGGVGAALLVGAIGSRNVMWIALAGVAMSILYAAWSGLYKLQARVEPAKFEANGEAV
jgi:predicted MFS family arabinose efflux permease